MNQLQTATFIEDNGEITYDVELRKNKDNVQSMSSLLNEQ